MKKDYGIMGSPPPPGGAQISHFPLNGRTSGTGSAHSRDCLPYWRETLIGSKSNFRLPSPHRTRLRLH